MANERPMDPPSRGGRLYVENEHIVNNSSAITHGRRIGPGSLRQTETRYSVQEEIWSRHLKLSKARDGERDRHVDVATLQKSHDNCRTGEPYMMASDGNCGRKRRRISPMWFSVKASSRHFEVQIVCSSETCEHLDEAATGHAEVSRQDSEETHCRAVA